ncbi:zinc finger domain-containing protein [Nocardia wallacei]|uniref:zinc finger domain-containing protein n=1 Tax=Nocardia wallacei TaxID=480035 RepID=UPI002455E24D|nr:hypothetical protein [Nocardia wallacei]
MRADIAFTRCPYCGAARRTPCFRPDGTPLRSGPHAARTHAYLRQLDAPERAEVIA